MDFVGSKVALFFGDKLVVFLRDDKPGLPNANKWDFFGGGREGDETPRECAIREIQEELGVDLPPDAFVWEKAHPALRDPSGTAFFLVADVTEDQVKDLVLTEGQRWACMDVQEFLDREDAVEGMKDRLRDYLELK